MQHLGAMVKTDRGDLLPETCRRNRAACEEDAANVFGPEVWSGLKARGYSVVSVQYLEVDTPWSLPGSLV